MLLYCCVSGLKLIFQFWCKNMKFFINIRIEPDNNDIKIKAVWCVDTGSFLNLFPKSLFDDKFSNFKLKFCNKTVSGIENKILPIIGTFECTIRTPSGYFKNIEFNVIDTNIPLLLGMHFFNEWNHHFIYCASHWNRIFSKNWSTKFP